LADPSAYAAVAPVAVETSAATSKAVEAEEEEKRVMIVEE
jgi:hypothetical protein